MLLIPILGRQRQEDGHKFKANLQPAPYRETLSQKKTKNKTTTTTKPKIKQKKKQADMVIIPALERLR